MWFRELIVSTDARPCAPRVTVINQESSHRKTQEGHSGPPLPLSKKGETGEERCRWPKECFSCDSLLLLRISDSSFTPWPHRIRNFRKVLVDHPSHQEQELL